MAKETKQTWQFKQSPEEVWEYLTKPELMEQWLMKTNFKPVKGYKFQFTFVAKPGSPYAGIVDCEVLEVKPFTRLSYSWNGSTNDGSRTFNSTVVWTLIPKEKGTELQLQHDGFISLDDFTNHNSGWIKCVEKMTDLLNSSSHASSNS